MSARSAVRAMEAGASGPKVTAMEDRQQGRPPPGSMPPAWVPRPPARVFDAALPLAVAAATLGGHAVGPDQHRSLPAALVFLFLLESLALAGGRAHPPPPPPCSRRSWPRS